MLKGKVHMENILSKFDEDLNVAIIGATGGIGRAFIDHLSTQKNVSTLWAFSRKKPEGLADKIKWAPLDICDENAAQSVINELGDIQFDIIINATGILSVGKKSPERSLRDINKQNFDNTFAVNSFGPALLMKYFLPLLNRDRRSVFASLSARVGSISDNELGGWYAYRASKAALNMLIKTASIEVARRNKQACVVGLHPGTVDTDLSAPFKSNVPEGKLFTPAFSAQSLLNVINNIQTSNTGQCLDWQGEIIEP